MKDKVNENKCSKPVSTSLEGKCVSIKRAIAYIPDGSDNS